MLNYRAFILVENHRKTLKLLFSWQKIYKTIYKLKILTQIQIDSQIESIYAII